MYLMKEQGVLLGVLFATQTPAEHRLDKQRVMDLFH